MAVQASLFVHFPPFMMKKEEDAREKDISMKHFVLVLVNIDVSKGFNYEL
jgi:hypothetical protein